MNYIMALCIMDGILQIIIISALVILITAIIRKIFNPPKIWVLYLTLILCIVLNTILFVLSDLQGIQGRYFTINLLVYIASIIGELYFTKIGYDIGWEFHDAFKRYKKEVDDAKENDKEIIRS